MDNITGGDDTLKRFSLELFFAVAGKFKNRYL